MVVRFYGELYSEDIKIRPKARGGCFPPVESNRMRLVCRDVTLEDVKKALFAMSPYKASGIDGYPATFYQHNWSVIGMDIFNFVSRCCLEGKMPKKVNQTLIVLISEVDNLTKLNNFRPISLCNVLYKVVTKVLVDRIKQVLPSLIAPTQSSFVPKRQIIDNVVIVHEVIHSMHNKRSGEGLMLFKLDLRKRMIV